MPKKPPKPVKATVQNGEQFRFERTGEKWFYNVRDVLYGNEDPRASLDISRTMVHGAPDWIYRDIPVDTVATVIMTPNEHAGRNKVAFTITVHDDDTHQDVRVVFQAFWSHFKQDTRYAALPTP